MKKLFTVSVLAIMAVSTANAEIASTQYVGNRTGNLEFTGQAEGKTDLTAAVNAIANAVGDTNVGAQIEQAIGNASVLDLSDGAEYAKTADVVTNEELEALDGNVTGSGVVTSISQADGNVTATLKKITDDEVDSISKDKITGLGALATKDTVTQAQVDGLETTLAGKLNTTDLAGVVTDGDVTHAVTGEAVAEAIKSANEDISLALDDKADKNDVYAKSEADGKFAPINTVEAAEQTAIDSAKNAAIAAAENQVKALDATFAAQEGKYIASVSQVDGTVAATYADLTDVAKMQVPEVCNGTATCALVWNKNTKKLDWEAIMQ
ncbi:MAG: hypothetical protein IJY99_00965 [Alphaproteobacteria bacterium]|nr:hypothetical protein [Alphaproteobacteria bacterium]